MIRRVGGVTFGPSARSARAIWPARGHLWFRQRRELPYPRLLCLGSSCPRRGLRTAIALICCRRTRLYRPVRGGDKAKLCVNAISHAGEARRVQGICPRVTLIAWDRQCAAGAFL